MSKGLDTTSTKLELPNLEEIALSGAMITTTTATRQWRPRFSKRIAVITVHPACSEILVAARLLRILLGRERSIEAQSFLCLLLIAQLLVELA
jgi:hypothetical protein